MRIDLEQALARLWSLTMGDELVRSVLYHLELTGIAQILEIAADSGLRSGALESPKQFYDYLDATSEPLGIGGVAPSEVDEATEFLTAVCWTPGLQFERLSVHERRMRRAFSVLVKDSSKCAQLLGYRNVALTEVKMLRKDLAALVDQQGAPLQWVRDAAEQFETDVPGLEALLYAPDLQHSLDILNNLYKLIGLDRIQSRETAAASPVHTSWKPSEPLIRLGDATDALIAEVATHPRSIFRLTGRDFEKFLRRLFEGFGYDVDLTAAARDGGIDLLCMRYDNDIPLTIAVEAKRYAEHRPISVDLVRSFVGANEQWRANKLVYVTTSRFTSDAIKYASQIRANLLTLADLQQVIKWARVHLER